MRAIGVVAAALAWCGTASAQDAPHPAVPVYVGLEDTGEELRGTLVRLGPETLTLLVNGHPMDLAIERVGRVQTPGDSVRNGALIGAVAGGVWCALVCGQITGAGPELSIFIALHASLWGGVGAGIDALIPGRTTIYQRPPSASARGAPPRAALSYRVRF